MRLDILARLIKKESASRPFQLATIPADYVSGRPHLIFDGEGTATVRTWPYLASYTPAATDRVLVAMAGKGGVVLGKIV